MKTCKNKGCTEENPQAIEAFNKCTRYADGHQNQCKSCQKKYDASRYLQRRDRVLAMSSTYYAENIEVARAKRALWRAENKDVQAKSEKAWRERNPGKSLAKTRKYSLAKIHRCPKWLSIDQIQAMVEVHESCPTGYEVDHIVPLQGKNVSGLHVPWNLQHLPISENRRKSNKY